MFVRFVRLEDVKPLVDAVNNAKTHREHDETKLIVDMIADLGTVLDEADVPPDGGRYFVIPAWYATDVIKKWLIKLHNLPAEQ